MLAERIGENPSSELRSMRASFGSILAFRIGRPSSLTVEAGVSKIGCERRLFVDLELARCQFQRAAATFGNFGSSSISVRKTSRYSAVALHQSSTRTAST